TARRTPSSATRACASTSRDSDVLDVDHLDVSIGATPILRAVSLQVPTGDLCGVIGRNGAGKTTLVRAIVGALPTRAGTITLGGVPLRPIAPYRRAQMGIASMPEDL